MHRCLIIQEILSIIFENLSSRHNLDQVSQSTLAGLARTCKAFHEPAIKALWVRIPNLGAIAGLFPPNTFVLVADASVVST